MAATSCAASRRQTRSTTRHERPLTTLTGGNDGAHREGRRAESIHRANLMSIRPLREILGSENRLGKFDGTRPPESWTQVRGEVGSRVTRERKTHGLASVATKVLTRALTKPVRRPQAQRPGRSVTLPTPEAPRTRPIPPAGTAP